MTAVGSPPVTGTGIAIDLTLSAGALPPARVHPAAAEVRRRHDAWFRRRLAADPAAPAAARRIFAECEGVGLMCAVLPDADPDRLLGISLAASVLLLLDDLTDADDGEVRRAEHYLAVVGGADPAGLPGGDDPAATGGLRLLADTLARVREGVPEPLWQRFTAGFAEVIAAGAAKSAEPMPDYAAYLRLRRADSAFDLIGVALEHGLGLAVPAGAETGASAPALAALHDAAFRHAILLNDLLSFRKEYFAREPMNAIQVLGRTRRLTMQQAVDVVCDEIGAAEREFATASAVLASVPEGAHGGVPPRYLDGWRQLLAGNLAWSLACPRYLGQAPAWDLGRGLPVRMVLHPDRTVYQGP